MADTRLTRLSEHLYRFRDICNVYALIDGSHALLIDSGSGAVAEALAATGVRSVDWVLHTHHHRDQCEGTPALAAAGARVAVPEHERYLFEDAELFWRTRRVYDNYDDRNTFFSAARDLPVHASLEDYETFTWRSYRFEVVPAKGHTRGSSMLIARIDGREVAFVGDLMTAGGRLYQLHAMEYAYGGMEGIAYTIQSIDALARRPVTVACPSHGEPITDPAGDIARLRRRLCDCVDLGEGMSVVRADLPATSFLPDLRLQPLSRHLLWSGPWACSNFYVVLSDSGKAMFVDYGHSLSTHMHTGLRPQRVREHALRGPPPRRAARRLRRDRLRPGGADPHPRRPHLRHSLPAAPPRHPLLGAARGGAGAGGPRRLGQHPLHHAQADPDRPPAAGRRPLHLGRVHLRHLPRTGPDRVPLRLRRAHRRAAGGVHGGQSSFWATWCGPGRLSASRTRPRCCATASSSPCTAAAWR